MTRRELVAASLQAPVMMAPPKRAKITSSVMLWCLKGTPEERLEIAARAGLQSVELVGEHLTMDVAAFQKRAKSLGLGIDTISSTPNWKPQKLNMVEPEKRGALLAEVESNLKYAQRMGVPMALLMSGDAVEGKSFEEQFASMVEGAKRCGDLAAKYGVTLIVEPLNTKVNHKGYFLSNCVDGLRLMKAVDHDHVRLLFDLYHEHVERGDVIKTLQTAMPYVKVFHVADSPGRHEPGTGEMVYKDLYKAISKAGYEGYITMEYLPTREPVESLQRAVTEMRAAL
jgi:hydroxypyruvate isomerase